ncbi:MAG: CBS domain-containing protein [Candidatus Altiarchaeales archaeon HGW-Altiarchaeales-2]|nr:MAG: CBS domain-containing protein [Candidatus Altiarchaeales archaeon HGW-Altiarchaeales-2]
MPKKKETKRSEEDEEKINDEERSDINNNGEVSIKVGDIMTTNVIGAKPGDTIAHIAKLMYANRIEAIVVIGKDKGKDKNGVITSKDIVYKVVAKGKNPKDAIAKDIMTNGIITISPNNTIDEAAILMRKYDIRRLPVANEKREIVGIITESDIARISPELHVLISEGSRIRDYAYRE